MIEDKRKVQVLDQQVVLDTSKLHFSENTLSEYLEQEGGWIDYYGAKLADAEKQMAQVELKVDKAESDYDKQFAHVFTHLKETHGGSDKSTEVKSKLEPSVEAAAKLVFDAKQELIEAKHIVKLMQQHLRAWTLNHENAQNRGNTLRREMDRRSNILEIDGIIKEASL